MTQLLLLASVLTGQPMASDTSATTAPPPMASDTSATTAPPPMAPPPKAPPPSQTLTAAEVARHDTIGDCWMIIDGVVYDVTPMVAVHPGGDAIARGCGKDASWYFANRDENGGHSANAITLLGTYSLGKLGAEAPEPKPVAPPPSFHMAGTRLGHQSTADVGPSKSIALRVSHHISTNSDIDSGISTQVGYSTGRFDFVLADEQSAGVGGLQVKGKLLSETGNRPKPISLAVVAGAGMAYTAGSPALYGQIIGQKGLMGSRLMVRANATSSMLPGASGSGQTSVGASVEFVPLPIHGVFVSVQTPLSKPSAVVWNAGFSFYTIQHAFALYASSTPSLHPVALSGEAPKAFSIGMSVERAFRLGR